MTVDIGPTSAISGRETLLFLGLCRWSAGCFAKEAGQRRLPGVAIKCIGCLFEFDSVEQALDVTRDRIRRHDQCGIERMNILARNRSLRVTDKGRDCDLGKPEIVRDAGKAVPQYMRRDIGE